MDQGKNIKVGIVRDDRYMLHRPGLVHPERPDRLKAIYKMLDKDFASTVTNIQPELATLEQIELVHTPTYVRKVLRTADRDFTNLAPDTPVCSKSYIAALLAVGGCIKGLQAMLSGRCDVCFALVRPPGHHAQRDRGEGFCIFNNLGVTARFSNERYGFNRILIVDWDIHHGNGIQNLFYGEKDVFYVSTHYRGWYPHTGDWGETGTGEGLGYTVNLPLPKNIQDNDLLYLYSQVLGLVMKNYRPELILVAAGFDGHCDDPMGRTHLTEMAYQGLTELMLDLQEAGGNLPVLLALEGGYHLPSLVSSVRTVINVLSGKRSNHRATFPPTELGAELLEKAYQIHRGYHVWTD